MKSSGQLLDAFKTEFENIRVKVRCICGGERVIPFLKNDRYGIPIVPAFCLDCGHIYARYRLSDADTQRFYSTIYRTLYSGESGLKTPEAAKPRIRNSEKVILAAFKRRFPDFKKRVVVEWGCGAGWNLVPFKEAGIETWGFDFDREYLEFGAQAFGLRLKPISENVETTAQDVPAADFLIVNHVLEHVPDPIALLNRLTSLLKPSGEIFIGLPFLENLPTWRFRGFFHIAHLHYFSIPYWKSLMEMSGLEVVETDRRRGFVVVRRGRRSEAAAVAHRAYNGYYLTKYAIFYQVIYPVWRLFVEIVKKVPGAEKSYVAATGFLHNLHMHDE